MSYMNVIPMIPTAEDKKLREKIFYLVCHHSQKIENHVLNCPTFRQKHNSAYDIECEICSKLLCFLDMVNRRLKLGDEINIEKMQKMGMIEHMILGDGIKLLE